MKTNNVDFGKSFKFICPEDDTIFTYTKGCEDYCKISWRDQGGDYSERKYTKDCVIDYITSGDWIVLPSETKDYTRECIDKLNAWVGCMSYNDSYFGEPAGMLKSVIRDLDKTYTVQVEAVDTGSLLDQIKHFTANSKHSVNVYEGVYEVFRFGEDMVYKCKDDDTLKNVMAALKVLDEVSVDEVGDE